MPRWDRACPATRRLPPPSRMGDRKGDGEGEGGSPTDPGRNPAGGRAIPSDRTCESHWRVPSGPEADHPERPPRRPLRRRAGGACEWTGTTSRGPQRASLGAIPACRVPARRVRPRRPNDRRWRPTAAFGSRQDHPTPGVTSGGGQTRRVVGLRWARTSREGGVHMGVTSDRDGPGPGMNPQVRHPGAVAQLVRAWDS